jgi:23S rRNA G2069 N7-methylase RlmK/C1962 C5-methylase RlmI
MKVIIKSNNSHQREYNVKSRSALVNAKELGRCEGGEVVEVRTNKGKLIDKAAWNCENQKYIRVCM